MHPHTPTSHWLIATLGGINFSLFWPCLHLDRSLASEDTTRQSDRESPQHTWGQTLAADKNLSFSELKSGGPKRWDIEHKRYLSKESREA